MAKDRSLVRASDIGMWAFCQRAWWLAQVQDEAHQNPEVLTRGDTAHASHGRNVALAGTLRQYGLLFIAASLLLLGLLLLFWIIFSL